LGAGSFRDPEGAVKRLIASLLAAAGIVGVAAALVYSGVFDIAADTPHAALTYRILEIVRDRSIAVRARGIKVPALDGAQLVASGAKDYADMCTDCHLAPDQTASELRDGLYPQPPKLTERIDATPSEMFWVIKHGIKLTAMPAWGPTHSDERIWGIVAFLQKLPDLTLDQYHSLAGANRAHEHHHHDDEREPHAHASDPQDDHRDAQTHR
jgi:mono/diheme cytochrome c family protein